MRPLFYSLLFSSVFVAACGGSSDSSSSATFPLLVTPPVTLETENPMLAPMHEQSAVELRENYTELARDKHIGSSEALPLNLETVHDLLYFFETNAVTTPLLDIVQDETNNTVFTAPEAVTVTLDCAQGGTVDITGQRVGPALTSTDLASFTFEFNQCDEDQLLFHGRAGLNQNVRGDNADYVIVFDELLVDTSAFAVPNNRHNPLINLTLTGTITADWRNTEEERTFAKSIFVHASDDSVSSRLIEYGFTDVTSLSGGYNDIENLRGRVSLPEGEANIFLFEYGYLLELIEDNSSPYSYYEGRMGFESQGEFVQIDFDMYSFDGPDMLYQFSGSGSVMFDQALAFTSFGHFSEQDLSTLALEPIDELTLPFEIERLIFAPQDNEQSPIMVQDIVFEGEARPGDGAIITYEWMIDDEPVPNVNSHTLPGGLASAGSTVDVRVTIDDGRFEVHSWYVNVLTP